MIGSTEAYGSFMDMCMLANDGLSRSLANSDFQKLLETEKASYFQPVGTLRYKRPSTLIATLVEGGISGARADQLLQRFPDGTEIVRLNSPKVLAAAKKAAGERGLRNYDRVFGHNSALLGLVQMAESHCFVFSAKGKRIIGVILHEEVAALQSLMQ